MKKNKFLLGIDLGGTRLRFILGDPEDGVIQDIDTGRKAKVSYDSPLNEAAVVFESSFFSKTPDNEKVAVYVVTNLIEYLTNLNICEKDIVGIGISVAGKVLKDRRFIGSNVPLKYTTKIGQSYGIEIVSILKNVFTETVNISIENDANCSGIVQASYYENKGIDPYKTFYITISTGIGGGGPKRDVDEVGHVNVDGYFPGLVPRCGCGSFGCIEAYASGRGIKNQAINILKLFYESPETFNEFNTFENIRTIGKYNLKHIVDQSVLRSMYLGKNKIDTKKIFELANIDELNNYTDQFATYLIEIAAERLAKVILTISNIHGIERFGIGGSVMINNPKFLDIVKAKLSSIYKTSNDIFKSELVIELSPLGEYISDCGALFLVVDPNFKKKWIEKVINTYRYSYIK